MDKLWGELIKTATDSYNDRIYSIEETIYDLMKELSEVYNIHAAFIDTDIETLSFEIEIGSQTIIMTEQEINLEQRPSLLPATMGHNIKVLDPKAPRTVLLKAAIQDIILRKIQTL